MFACKFNYKLCALTAYIHRMGLLGVFYLGGKHASCGAFNYGGRNVDFCFVFLNSEPTEWLRT
jgi:hypothetical protein